MKIIHLPIEPFPQRYSEDWLTWYKVRAGVLDQFYLGISAYTRISDGSFLDVTGTLIYKNQQMVKVLQYIQNNKDLDWSKTVFFFHDLWHPGVTDLLYVRDGLKFPFKIAGMLHAGTYDPYDFLTRSGMASWGTDIEMSWFNAVDMIFVATVFHKNLLIDSRIGSNNFEKIKVTGFPIYPRYDFEMEDRFKGVLFPHRLDPEKQPKLFHELAYIVGKRRQDIYFDKTFGMCDSKSEYYERLRKYRVSVSFALQETWGIAMQESVFAGCIPLVPDRLSYTEMYFEEFKYGTEASIEEIADKTVELTIKYKEPAIKKLLEEQYNILREKGRRAIDVQKNYLKELVNGD